MDRVCRIPFIVRHYPHVITLRTESVLVLYFINRIFNTIPDCSAKPIMTNCCWGRFTRLTLCDRGPLRDGLRNKLPAGGLGDASWVASRCLPARRQLRAGSSGRSCQWRYSSPGVIGGPGPQFWTAELGASLAARTPELKEHRGWT